MTVLYDHSIDPGARLMFLALIEMDSRNVRPGACELCRILGVSHHRLNRYCAQLVAQGYVVVEKQVVRNATGASSANWYRPVRGRLRRLEAA